MCGVAPPYRASRSMENPGPSCGVALYSGPDGSVVGFSLPSLHFPLPFPSRLLPSLCISFGRAEPYGRSLTTSESSPPPFIVAESRLPSLPSRRVQAAELGLELPPGPPLICLLSIDRRKSSSRRYESRPETCAIPRNSDRSSSSAHLV